MLINVHSYWINIQFRLSTYRIYIILQRVHFRPHSLRIGNPNCSRSCRLYFAIVPHTDTDSSKICDIEMSRPSWLAAPHDIRQHWAASQIWCCPTGPTSIPIRCRPCCAVSSRFVGNWWPDMWSGGRLRRDCCPEIDRPARCSSCKICIEYLSLYKYSYLIEFGFFLNQFINRTFYIYVYLNKQIYFQNNSFRMKWWKIRILIRYTAGPKWLHPAHNNISII